MFLGGSPAAEAAGDRAFRSNSSGGGRCPKAPESFKAAPSPYTSSDTGTADPLRFPGFVPYALQRSRRPAGFPLQSLPQAKPVSRNVIVKYIYRNSLEAGNFPRP